MILGTISAVDDVTGLQLIIDGEDEPTTKKYTYMASYVPTANDRVLIEEISGSYVIMGKVISAVSDSGIVRQASNATNAENATNAANADKATKADSADTATNLSGASQQSGKLVSYVTTEWNSTLNKNIVTAVGLAAGPHNFIYK